MDLGLAHTARRSPRPPPLPPRPPPLLLAYFNGRAAAAVAAAALVLRRHLVRRASRGCPRAAPNPLSTREKGGEKKKKGEEEFVWCLPTLPSFHKENEDSGLWSETRQIRTKRLVKKNFFLFLFLNELHSHFTCILK